MRDRGLAAWRTIVVIGASYFAQGLVAFVGAVMAVYLAFYGTPLEDYVGILASGAAPWVLKFAVAPLLDFGPSWSYRLRAGVASVLLLAVAVGLWVIADLWPAKGPPTALVELAIAWLVLNGFLAVQDVLIDGLAVDSLSERRAWTATAMSGGHVVGGALVGPMWIQSLIVTDGLRLGISAISFAIIGVALVPVLLLWVPGRPRKARQREAATTPRAATDWMWLLAVPIVSMAAWLGVTTNQAGGAQFMAGLGWDPELTTSLMPLAGVAMIAGVLVWGALVGRIGPALASAIAATAWGTSYLIWAFLPDTWVELGAIQIRTILDGFLEPALLVGLHALALVAASRSPLPITAFVIAMAAINLPRVIGPLLAPRLLDHGWFALFAVCGAVAILAGIGLALTMLRMPGRAGQKPVPAI